MDTLAAEASPLLPLPLGAYRHSLAVSVCVCVCVCARARVRACVVCAGTNVQARKSADLESKKGLLNAHRDGMIQPLLRLTRHCSNLPLQPFISTHLLCVCVCVCVCVRARAH